MNYLNTYATFGIMFLAATLLASGMYSNQIFAPLTLDLNHDGKINLHEAEINADIEQENKCKKDTECENENEINNLLNITTITTTVNGNHNGNGNGNGNEQPDCHLCFAVEPDGDWPQGLLNNLNDYLDGGNPTIDGTPVSSVDELCEALENAQEPVEASSISEILHAAIPGNGEDEDNLVNTTIQCLAEAGLVVV